MLLSTLPIAFLFGLIFAQTPVVNPLELTYDVFNITSCFCHEPIFNADLTIDRYVSGRYLGISYFNNALLKTYAFNTTERVEGTRILYDLIEENTQPFQNKVCERFESKAYSPNRKQVLCYVRKAFSAGKFTFNHHHRKLNVKDYPRNRHFYIDLTNDCADRCVDDLRFTQPIVDKGSMVSYFVKPIPVKK